MKQAGKPDHAPKRSPQIRPHRQHTSEKQNRQLLHKKSSPTPAFHYKTPKFTFGLHAEATTSFLPCHILRLHQPPRLSESWKTAIKYERRLQDNNLIEEALECAYRLLILTADKLGQTPRHTKQTINKEGWPPAIPQKSRFLPDLHNQSRFRPHETPVRRSAACAEGPPPPPARGGRGQGRHAVTPQKKNPVPLGPLGL